VGREMVKLRHQVSRGVQHLRGLGVCGVCENSSIMDERALIKTSPLQD
jgi:hypothetical protein